MKYKPVIRRALADRDVQQAIDYHLGEATKQVALGFVDALKRACWHMGRHPAGGSTRCARELDLPGHRYGPLKRYPYLVFYVERKDHVDVWRIQPCL